MKNQSEFEAYVQEKVNEVGMMLIEKFPDVAKNNPKQIGKMAKMMVFEALDIAIDRIKDEK